MCIIVYLYILPALLIISLYVSFTIKSLASFPLGDAPGSTNRRLYATTGTITSPLVTSGPHLVSYGPRCQVPTSWNRLRPDVTVVGFCEIAACSRSF